MSCAVIVSSTFIITIANVAFLISWNAQQYTLSNLHMLQIHVQPHMDVDMSFKVFVHV